jgi:SNF family Na+-dependent transporter
MANGELPPPPRRQGCGENWGTKLGVILAVAGSAVGLGNFLRFPGTAAQHGGGIFMIPYFISLLLVGIPLCWAEWAMGRYGGSRGHNSAPGIFRMVWGHPGSKYIGVLALIIPVVIYMYYVYIEVWCLSYVIDYVGGTMTAVVEKAPAGRTDVQTYVQHFSDKVGLGQNGFPSGRMLWLVGITFFLNFALIYMGLTRGIEVFCKFAMPVLVVFAIIVLCRVLSLGTPNPAFPDRNIANALGFMWNPQLATDQPLWQSLKERLSDSEMWLAAAGQIFFSLSVGFGIILNYSSYLKPDDDVALSGLTASASNEFCEVILGGLITVPLAFLFLSTVEMGKLDSTVSLGFMTLPSVFHRMPAGDFFGAMWFLMLFMAAMTSSLSMLQPAIAFFEEGFHLKRHDSVYILVVIVAFGAAIVMYFSKDLLALDTMDFWVGSFLIFLLAMIQTILFGWVLGRKKGMAELERGAEIPIPCVFWYIIKYVSPVYLLAIFVGFCIQKVPGYWTQIMDKESEDAGTVRLVLIFILGLFAFFGLMVHLAGRRWDHEASQQEEL